MITMASTAFSKKILEFVFKADPTVLCKERSIVCHSVFANLLCLFKVLKPGDLSSSRGHSKRHKETCYFNIYNSIVTMGNARSIFCLFTKPFRLMEKVAVNPISVLGYV